MHVTRTHPEATIPTRAHAHDAGYDLSAASGATIEPGQTLVVGTGIAIALAPGTVGLVCPRSGLAARHSITIVNAPGIVDAGYRGEVKVALHNLGSQPFTFAAGDRIAQLVLTPILTPELQEVDLLPETSDGRGAGALGSTGVQPRTPLA